MYVIKFNYKYSITLILYRFSLFNNLENERDYYNLVSRNLEHVYSFCIKLWSKPIKFLVKVPQPIFQL